MAQFPGSIDYKNVSPSGNISAVGKPQTPTGGPEAIVRGMKDLKQGFERVQEQKDASEYSTMKRKFDESANAHLQTYIQTGDPEERKKILQKWNEDVESIRGGSDRVNRQFQMYKDARIPDVGQTFANHELAIQTRQVDDNDKINITAAMKNGDLTEAATIYHNRYKLNRISEAEMNQAITELPNEAVLTQAENAIGNNNGQEALKALSKVKDMNPEQTTQYHKLNIWAKQVSKIGNDDSKDSILGLMLQNDNMEYGEKAKQAEKMQEIASKNLTGDERAKWQMIVIPNWLSGKNEVDNQEIVVQLAEDKRDAYLGNFKEGTTEPLRMSDVTDYVRKAAEDGKIKLSTRDKILKEDYKEFEKYQVHSLNEEMKWAKGDIVQKGKQPLTLANFEIATPDGEPITPTDSLSQEQSEKLQYVEEGLKKYIKNHKDVMDYEIRTERQKLVAMALSGYTQKPTGETFGPPAPSLEQIGKPKPEELRKQNTEEAYNKGVQLGYWQ